MASSFIAAVFLCTYLASAQAITTVDSLNPEFYVGRWYQVYTNYWTNLVSNLPNPTCITADYAAINATYISVYNANYALETGEFQSISGYAFIPDLDKPGQLKVYLDGVPVLGDYWVFELGPIVENQYDYSLVSTPSARQLFVLARDPQRFYDLYDRQVRRSLISNGFASSPLTMFQSVPHDGCTYADQPW